MAMAGDDGRPVATCHCGKVAITVPHAPAIVVECNCSFCRRLGVLWMYYDIAAVEGLPAAGETSTYAWGGRHVDFRRCAECGCTTHWFPRDAKRTTLGINARLLPPELVVAARLRHKDGANTGRYLD